MEEKSLSVLEAMEKRFTLKKWYFRNQEATKKLQYMDT